MRRALVVILFGDLPPLPAGKSFLVTASGAYLVDASGNFLTT